MLWSNLFQLVAPFGASTHLRLYARALCLADSPGVYKAAFSSV